MLKRLLMTAAILGLGMSVAAHADDYKFNLQNNSKYEIIGFETCLLYTSDAADE